MAIRKTNEQSLGEVIKQIISDFRFKDKLLEVRINTAWKKVMGAQIESYTDRLVFKNAVLTVFLKSAPLREELHMARTRIAKLINKELNENAIKEIILR